MALILISINYSIADDDSYLCPNPWLNSVEHLLRWGAPVFPLACGDIQSVSCLLQKSLKWKQAKHEQRCMIRAQLLPTPPPINTYINK